jgi:hypothetical protein
MLASAAGRTIRWRGIEYTMHSMTQTTVSRPPEPEPEVAIAATASTTEALPEPATRISTP